MLVLDLTQALIGVLIFSSLITVPIYVFLDRKYPVAANPENVDIEILKTTIISSVENIQEGQNLWAIAQFMNNKVCKNQQALEFLVQVLKDKPEEKKKLMLLLSNTNFKKFEEMNV